MNFTTVNSVSGDGIGSNLMYSIKD